MNQDDIIRMAREAGLYLPYWDEDEDPEKDPPRWTMVSPLPPLLKRFAALVIANNPPQSFMSWQEGFEAGKQTEREACAKVCEEGGRDESGRIHVQAWACAKAIRARGNK